MKRMAYIGGFGHWSQVAEEFRSRDDVDVVGVSPAYEGEDVTVLQEHAALPADIVRFESASELLAEVKPDVAIVRIRSDWIARTAILPVLGVSGRPFRTRGLCG